MRSWQELNSEVDSVLGRRLFGAAVESTPRRIKVLLNRMAIEFLRRLFKAAQENARDDGFIL